MMTKQARSSSSDHGIRHPHDLGNRACSAFKPRSAHQVINPTSRHLAEALPVPDVVSSPDSGLPAGGADTAAHRPRVPRFANRPRSGRRRPHGRRCGHPTAVGGTAMARSAARAGGPRTAGEVAHCQAWFWPMSHSGPAAALGGRQCFSTSDGIWFVRLLEIGFGAMARRPMWDMGRPLLRYQPPFEWQVRRGSIPGQPAGLARHRSAGSLTIPWLVVALCAHAHVINCGSCPAWSSEAVPRISAGLLRLSADPAGRAWARPLAGPVIFLGAWRLFTENGGSSDPAGTGSGVAASSASSL